MSGPRVLKGKARGKKAGFRYTEGPHKGKTMGQAIGSSRHMYAGLSGGVRRKYERIGRGDDIRDSQQPVPPSNQKPSPPKSGEPKQGGSPTLGGLVSAKREGSPATGGGYVSKAPAINPNPAPKPRPIAEPEPKKKNPPPDYLSSTQIAAAQKNGRKAREKYLMEQKRKRKQNSANPYKYKGSSMPSSYAGVPTAKGRSVMGR